jgi:hypothetical protein
MHCCSELKQRHSADARSIDYEAAGGAMSTTTRLRVGVVGFSAC